jgi:hypothetical protein
LSVEVIKDQLLLYGSDALVVLYFNPEKFVDANTFKTTSVKDISRIPLVAVLWV